jgi:hypothetical protein
MFIVAMTGSYKINHILYKYGFRRMPSKERHMARRRWRLRASSSSPASDFLRRSGAKTALDGLTGGVLIALGTQLAIEKR